VSLNKNKRLGWREIRENGKKEMLQWNKQEK
jgi:hypothetical protein